MRSANSTIHRFCLAFGSRHMIVITSNKSKHKEILQCKLKIPIPHWMVSL
jgi:hypothetical protein